jgi:alanine racemase
MRAARAEVDLGAVAHNVGVLRALVAPSLVCAVVKADGYGHGAIAVSEAALDAGADWLAVALIEEAAVLRKAGITAPILLLSQPRLADLAAVVRYDLRVCIISPVAAELLANAARDQGKIVPVHLKVDTGMNRIGVAPADALALARDVVKRPELLLEGIFTHCAVADEPDNPFTDEQLDRYEAVLAKLGDAGIFPSIRHSANSAIAIAHPRGRYDLVRVGIAVYGISPAPGLEGTPDLRPALSLRAEVAFVKRVTAGEGVSYGLRHRFEADATVATVPIGYADGFGRVLGNGNYSVYINNKKAPTIGNICMDMCMVDVTNLDCNEGDEVIIFGDINPIADVAKDIGTIPYEVLTTVSRRVKRVYYQE